MPSKSARSIQAARVASTATEIYRAADLAEERETLGELYMRLSDAEKTTQIETCQEPMGRGWQAWIKGSEEIWERADTRAEAICKLMVSKKWNGFDEMEITTSEQCR